jgi:hypothetical protein
LNLAVIKRQSGAFISGDPSIVVIS